MHIQNLIPPTEQPRSFKPGQAIFTEGDYGDFMYVLLEGSVEVLVHGKSVGTFDPVELFGEMAIIDPQPRSATVMAKTACKLARINRPRFLVLVQGQPEFALQVMQGLVDRIRWMDSTSSASGDEHAQQIAALQEEAKTLETAIEGQKKEIESLQQRRQLSSTAARP